MGHGRVLQICVLFQRQQTGRIRAHDLQPEGLFRWHVGRDISSVSFGTSQSARVPTAKQL